MKLSKKEKHDYLRSLLLQHIPLMECLDKEEISLDQFQWFKETRMQLMVPLETIKYSFESNGIALSVNKGIATVNKSPNVLLINPDKSCSVQIHQAVYNDKGFFPNIPRRYFPSILEGESFLKKSYSFPNHQPISYRSPSFLGYLREGQFF